MEKTENSPTRDIIENGMIAALYYALTMLFVLVPAISQFGPIQCRISEFLVLLAFFKPRYTIGLTIGCFFVNLTGVAMSQSVPLDLVFGTLATLISCLAVAYLSPCLAVATIWPVLFNGIIVGVEIYWLFNFDNLPIYATMGYVAIGEAIAMAVGYALLMVLVRSKPFMRLLSPTRHENARF